MIWENDHQRSKKSPLKEIDTQMAPTHLFLIILIVLVMICIIKDAQWHLAQNLSFFTPWRKIMSGPKIIQGVKLQTLLLLWNITPKGLRNHISNIPKKTIYTELQGGSYFSLHCDGKFRQQGDHWFFQEILSVKALIWTRYFYVDPILV